MQCARKREKYLALFNTMANPFRKPLFPIPTYAPVGITYTRLHACLSVFGSQKIPIYCWAALMCSLKFTLTGKEQKDAITEKRERERRLGREQGDLTNTCQNCNACHVVVMTIPEPKCRNCSIIAPGNTLPRENCIKRERERQGGEGIAAPLYGMLRNRYRYRCR